MGQGGARHDYRFGSYGCHSCYTLNGAVSCCVWNDCRNGGIKCWNPDFREALRSVVVSFEWYKSRGCAPIIRLGRDIFSVPICSWCMWNWGEGWWVWLVTKLEQSREHVYWLKYQCRDIISWIGGGPRSTVGIAMEEEGVVVEVARCVCVCLSGLACSYVPTYISYRSYGITIYKHSGSMLS